MVPSSSGSSGVSRRSFLTASGAALMMTARSYGRIIGANDRIRIGIIGCGGMATGHMTSIKRRMLDGPDNCEMIAVCDLWDKRLATAADLTGGKPYKHHRDLLANKDVDYILNATPEHMHVHVILDALDAGKHVYTEKPMTRTIEHAKKVVAKVKATKLKLQVGVQGTSDDSYITANKYIKDGVLGRVVLAQIDYSRNHKDDFWADPDYPIDTTVQPGVNLDWKTWLADTPKRAYDADRFFRWRRYWDYSGGISGDLFVHRVTRLIKSIGVTFPEKGVGSGGKFEFRESKAEIPDTFNVLLDYPEGLTIQLVSSMANDRKIDHLIRGHKATLEFTDTGFNIVPQRMFRDEVKPVTYKKTGAEDVVLHHRNLQAAIRRDEPLNCDVMLGYYGVVASEMGVQSFRQQKYMKWDKAKERLVRA